MTCRGFGQSALPDRDAAPDLTARIAERRNFNAPLAVRPQAGRRLRGQFGLEASFSISWASACAIPESMRKAAWEISTSSI